MNTNHNIIFGAGLIGGYLAGAFSARGLSALLVGRSKTQSALANGLTVSDMTGNQVTIDNIEFYSAIEHQQIDTLWLTVKCTAVEASLIDLKDIVQPDTIIICCQNGFGSDHLVRQAFPNNVVLNAVVGFNVAEHAPAHLHRSTDGKLIIEYHKRLEAFIAKVDSPLLPTASSHHFVADQWAKLQLNLANPVNALANIPVKSMTEDPGYRRIIAQLMDELLLVTDALNLKLPKVTAAPARMLPKLMRLPNWIFNRLAQKMLAIDPSARTSMWWDLSQGKPSEINYLNGAVVHQAKALNLPCPYNRKIVELVHRVEAGELALGLSADALMTALNESA
ncbi:2-dehydropantoate 2-reductase [Arenicella xantha]|uniref:2-dehydropantoate 2-reductase n=1 Tax=Arenicella xantha TaxID=644221 RepID=A0A395JLA2_9GAMM|nr:2-dehydropantoate 2-reductase [Arenicella xantha]RBP51542.1 ketopantoate reductase [Arenicella xantha]